MEFISWIVSLALFCIGLKVIFYTPSYKFDDSNQVEWKNNEINSFLDSMGLICILLSLSVLIVAFFIRRTRRKKAQVYELTQLIKNL